MQSKIHTILAAGVQPKLHAKGMVLGDEIDRNALAYAKRKMAGTANGAAEAVERPAGHAEGDGGSVH